LAREIRNFLLGNSTEPRLDELSIESSSRPKRVAYRTHDGIIVGKEDPAFLGDLLVSDPDGEFTAAAFDQFNIGPERVFDGGRHTGGAWPVRRSDFTETDSNFTHVGNFTTLREACWHLV
jgi:hypothetical protein